VAAAFNYRQIALLDELDRRAFLSARDCVQFFGVSRVTAFRDLEELRRQGIVRRHGKGRASQYARVRS
jgi:DeoR/GlpR family transcriptional regulator of sugar metabolism